MVTCQSSELGWEVTVELPTDFLSLGRGSVRDPSGTPTDSKKKTNLSFCLNFFFFKSESVERTCL